MWLRMLLDGTVKAHLGTLSIQHNVRRCSSRVVELKEDGGGGCTYSVKFVSDALRHSDPRSRSGWISRCSHKRLLGECVEYVVFVIHLCGIFGVFCGFFYVGIRATCNIV